MLPTISATIGRTISAWSSPTAIKWLVTSDQIRRRWRKPFHQTRKADAHPKEEIGEGVKADEEHCCHPRLQIVGRDQQPVNVDQKYSVEHHERDNQIQQVNGEAAIPAPGRDAQPQRVV